LVRRVHQADHQALLVLLVFLVQLGPLVLAQAAQQAPQAFKGLLGSQEHLAQQAHREQRELLEPPAQMEPQGPRELPASLAPLAFKAQQAQEPQALLASVLLEPPGQLERAQQAPLEQQGPPVQG
jgi:hypothetical protein